MRILFIEENVHDYLGTRRILDEQAAGNFTLDWAPNCESARKSINQKNYDVYMLGYYSDNPQQGTFLTWLCEFSTIPIVLLTRTEQCKEKPFINKYKVDCIDKNLLTWQLLQRIITHIISVMHLYQQEQLLRTMLDHTFEWIGLLKPDGTLVEINYTALAFINVPREAVIGQQIWDTPWAKASAHTVEQFKTAVSAASQGESIRYEIEVQEQQEQWITLDFLLTPIFSEQGHVRWILAEGHNLSERKRVERELRHATLHDTLTGLPNRHLFIEHLEKAIARTQEQENYHIAVLMVDLDRFRVVNDSLGHDMGDWLLMDIAHRLQTCLSKETFIARSSGDEFMILLDNIQDLTEATRLAAAINAELSSPFSLDGHQIVTSASIGIAYNNGERDSIDLLRDADTAMYKAKSMGKSCYVVFNDAMHSKAVSRLRIECDLYEALQQQNFLLFYQPQIDLTSQHLIGTEALLRFRHPRQGLLSPVHFMPILEDTGMIVTLGEWILQTACQQLKSWFNQGLNLSHVSVNVSAQQFLLNRKLTYEVANAIERAGLQPGMLELELTESILLEDTRSALRTLAQFKEMGVRVAIDDFGTGYASLSYLKQFPANSLKIDKSFTQGIHASGQDAAIIVATIDMAHALGLTVTAEGVETTEQRDFLQDHACDTAQGYLYAQAMENTIFVNWAKQYQKMTT